MRVTVTIDYTEEDLRRSILANSPYDDTSLDVYQELRHGDVRLLAVIRIPNGAADPDAAAWILATWTVAAGQDLVLFIDHATICDLVATHAIETCRRLGLRPQDHPRVLAHAAGSQVGITVTFALDTESAPTIQVLSGGAPR